MLYTKLKQREKAIKELTALGVVPMTVIRNIEIFEHFNTYAEELCTYCKYELTAEHFGMSSDRVKSIVLMMKK